MPSGDLKFGYRDIGRQSVPTVEFVNAVDPMCLAVFGHIASWAPGTDHEKRQKWQEWHIKVAREINARRGDTPWTGNEYAISIGMAFDRLQELDVDNHIKPILDAIAAGLFCQDLEHHIKPVVDAINAFHKTRKMQNLGNIWTFDDSKFKTVLAHRLPDPGNHLSSPWKEEGIAICISRST